MTNNTLNLYQSDLHSCSYLPQRQAITVFADPKANMDSVLYEHLLQLGFRRSGNYVYTPKCPACNACISIRVKADSYQTSRNHKRVLNKNTDLEVRRVPAQFEAEHFDLYQKYIAGRHDGGGMENPTEKDYLSFLTSSWSDTWFFEFRLQQQLVAVMVVDELPQSLSAVYTFFDMQQQQRSPGHYAILYLLQQAKLANKPWVYLGYYISNCNKMNYKSRYRPFQALIGGKWHQYNQGDVLSF